MKKISYGDHFKKPRFFKHALGKHVERSENSKLPVKIDCEIERRREVSDRRDGFRSADFKTCKQAVNIIESRSLLSNSERSTRIIGTFGDQQSSGHDKRSPEFRIAEQPGQWLAISRHVPHRFLASFIRTHDRSHD